MKTHIIILILLFIGVKNFKCQTPINSDVIILLDNSGSIDEFEFNQMITSTNLLIEGLVKCNNRVSIIHYGTNSLNLPGIFIQSDFTNTPPAVINPASIAGNDFLHESLGLIANALDNVPNPNIVSTQQTLTKNPATPLVVFIFTDAFRSNPGFGSYLVNVQFPGMSTSATPNDQAFTNYTSFKNNRNATFVIVHVSPDNTAQVAAAGIASVGGNYNGAVEPYPADPGFNTLPRLYFPQSSFILSTANINSLTQSICNIVRQPYVDIVLEPQTSCFNSNLPYSGYGNYSLPNGSTLVNINLFMKNTSTGTVYPLSSPANLVSASQYQFTINPNSFDPTMPLYGQYYFVAVMTFSNGTTNSTISGNNIYSTTYAYDVNFDCCGGGDLYITSPVSSNTTDSQSSNTTIYASNIINNSATAVYHAGSTVNLTVGFHARSGSNFHAFIQPCVNVDIANDFDFNSISPLAQNSGINSKTLSKYTTDYETENLSDIKISPNPASEIMNIITAQGMIDFWELYDLSGKMVRKGTTSTVYVADLPKAVYIIKIKTENKVISKKVTVQ